eukprot:TRINITY_DN22927_c0_g1_i2.p1 TRINITY_DN22927_c0_g1~~TRINITY_DN22927_c0_g1_i2.p1  ORF type:complete len:325 (-),score=60.76 TRINITY_DN22927_c0_g1_i2:166-1140(-)
MAVLRRQVSAFASFAILLVGWLSPPYAAKLCASELTAWLEETPVLAALLVQAAWAPLVLVLWNTDTVTTLLIAAAASGQAPSCNDALGAFVGLLGASIAVGFSDKGDTLVGCSMCFAASLGYACNAVVVQHLIDPKRCGLLRLLALEGLVAALAIVIVVFISLAVAPGFVTSWFAKVPGLGWVAFLASSCLMLNLGWLRCTASIGATWTAMVACLSIPISIALDAYLLSIRPSVAKLIGSVLVIVGFAVSSWHEEGSADSVLDESTTPSAAGECGTGRSTPFLSHGALQQARNASVSTIASSSQSLADRHHFDAESSSPVTFTA